MFYLSNYLTKYQSIFPAEVKFRLPEAESPTSANKTDEDNATDRIKSLALKIKNKPKLSSACFSCLVHCVCFTKKQL